MIIYAIVDYVNFISFFSKIENITPKIYIQWTKIM